MDLVLSLEFAEIIAIAVMVGCLVFAYVKKWMMTYALIIANVFVFVLGFLFLVQISSGEFISLLAIKLAFQPIYLQEDPLYLYTLFTSMFAHAGFAHIFGNMLIFFFIGMAFEQRIGPKNFILIYLLSGFFAALFHAAVVPLIYPESFDPSIPLLGASGAIFGIMGAFAYSYPHDKVVMPIPIGIMFITRIKVMYAVIIFAGLETVITWFEASSGVMSGTAHFAHLGGLLGGFILAVFLVKRKKTYDSFTGETSYYQSGDFKQAHRKIDFSTLRQLAVTNELQDMLDRIEQENVDQVRNIWLDHFLERLHCPKCKSSLKNKNSTLYCERCGFRTKY